ncbi:pentatricopeptide repeat-containing protein At1g14470 [Aristolochia californica]|uniref:pentatricopeptide repeat-containing protein At1g14470 n=1 Tax=Aristolochia californica TaxID=171875 RepID=UPI0035D67C88
MSYLEPLASNVKTFNQLKQLHAQILHHSFQRQSFWLANLLRICTIVRAPLEYARQLFESIPQPNVIIFTSLLKFYSQLNSHSDVLELFARMRTAGVSPDAFVFPILFKSTTAHGTVIQAHVLKLGLNSDRYIKNALLDMYAKRGPIVVARELFDEMPDKAPADWNAMISGYWRWGDEAGAKEMFETMQEKNIISWTAMVSGYSKTGDLVKARYYFDRMPQKSVVSWNAMLTGYSQNGLAEEALSLFKEMMNNGVKPDETTWVTVISSCSACGDLKLAESLVRFLDNRQLKLNFFIKTAFIDMYAKCGSLDTARKIFDEMKNKNVVSWNAMISGYARHGDLASSRELFDKMPEKNLVSWNSMIAGYAQNGHSTMAIELFKEMAMMEDVIKPDEVTMVSVVSACGHVGALQLGKWAVDIIMNNKIELKLAGYNALIYMYSRCGGMKEAKKIFQSMPSRDIVSYNSLIAGYAAHGHGYEAVDLMSKLTQEGIEPDRITFISLLTACSHAGLLQEGKRIFESIKEPAIDHYACMVDLLGRAGDMDEATKLLDTMPMKPHAGLYGALLNASRIHGRVELGELAARKLFELEPENSGNYVLLSNIYASANRWDDVEWLMKMMRQRRVKKTTGWSWIEFNGRIHRFVAGDRSHERTADIYRSLKELGQRMKSLGYLGDKSCVLRDVEEEEKEQILMTHSEKLAIAFGLLVTEAGTVIRVVKNLRICSDCHISIRMISNFVGREIIVRDNNRFHCFKHGECSCKDYW